MYFLSLEEHQVDLLTSVVVYNYVCMMMFKLMFCVYYDQCVMILD